MPPYGRRDFHTILGGVGAGLVLLVYMFIRLVDVGAPWTGFLIILAIWIPAAFVGASIAVSMGRKMRGETRESSDD